MIAILFELWPAASRADEYFGLAAALKPELERIDGFISVERFQSLSDPAKLLSLSFFRDEEAVREWRNLPGHRDAQTRGRAGILADYRLRVAQVLCDYGMTIRDEAPHDSRQAHAEPLAKPR
jgi:heme-degrading monooxygenase HmoA